MFFIRKLKTVLTVIGIILALLLLTFLICLKLAYTDDNTDKYYSTPDISSVKSIALNAVLGNETDITEEQINSVIAYLIEQANEKGLFNKNYKLIAAYIDINTGKTSRCYFQIEHKDKKLGFSADIEISVNEATNQIQLIFGNAKVGKLPIPKSFIVHELKKTEIEIISHYLSIDELAISIPTHVEFKLSELDLSVNVDIINLEVYEDQVHIETNPILNDTLNDIKNSIGDKIIDYAQDHLPDGLGGYLDKFKQSD